MSIKGTFLNEEVHFRLQSEVDFYGKIKKEFDEKLNRILATYNISTQLSRDLVPVEDIKDLVKQQTKETIELYKGGNEEVTVVNYDQYMDVLISRLDKNHYNIGYIKYYTPVTQDTEKLIKQVIGLYQYEIYKDTSQFQNMVSMTRIFSNDKVFLIGIGLFMSTSLALSYIWKEKWYETLTCFGIATSISGFTMFTLFSFYYKVSFLRDTLNISGVRKNMMVMALRESYHQLHQLGGLLLMGSILIVGLATVYKNTRRVH